MAREFSIRNFDKGLVTELEDFSIPEQAASRSLNWLTLGDKIELSGGYRVIGTENSGAGKITGLKIAEKVDGTLLPIRTRGKKIEYYTTDWVESGTDALGTDADGEDIAITTYTSLAGYQAWLSSPNSGLFKMMLANPGSIKDLYDSAENFKGYIKAINGGLYLWYRKNNKNYVYRSYKDLQNSTVYTDVSAEAVGVSGSAAYSGTLSQVTGHRTCFNVVITDGTLTVSDDKDGNLTGDGTGTINYATGAYSVTFSGNTTAAVTANYSWEDSTEKGLADFTFNVVSRAAAEGFFLPQATGGDLLDVQPYRDDLYCIHQRNAWLLTVGSDDTTVSNLEWNQNIGMKSWRAAVSTGDGIYYIDTSDAQKPVFKLITLQVQNDQIIPVPISFNIDLTGYDFSDGVGFKWGDYVVFEGKVNGASYNNRMFAYHTTWKSFDQLKYPVSCLDNYDGALWAGDSGSNNVLKLFSGFTANGSNIENYWEGKLSKLEVDQLKKFKRLTLRGQIGPTQELKISLAYDGGSFVEVGRVEGDGDYVSGNTAVTVGSTMVGSAEIGGGGSGVSAYDYVAEFRVRSRKFDEVKIRIEAVSVGYASVSEINYYDIKTYGQKNLLRYRT